VLVFPEGTSHTAEKMLPLRNATFNMAVENNIPVLPVAIEYRSPRDGFVDDDTFVPHFFKCFGNWKTVVALHFAEPLRGGDTEKLKASAAEIIDRNVSRLRNLIGYRE
jgi:1-acyl-sn-glycerol-3-phosphate acyltransferase